MHSLVACLTLMAVLSSSWIIVRHDVPDSHYVAHSKDKRFQPFVYFDDGCGTLIASNWVLTARHVANELGIGDVVHFKKGEYPIEDVVLFPSTKQRSCDLGLVRIKTFGHRLPHTDLVAKPPAVNEIVHLIGRGDFGNGLTGPHTWDKIVRGAINRIDAVNDDHITFEFDSPVSARVSRLEGISGPGDSGGPAFIERDGKVLLAGVSSVLDLNGRAKEGVYGVKDLYVNIVTYRSWIDTVVGGRKVVAFNDGDLEIHATISPKTDTIERATIDGRVMTVNELNRYRDQILRLSKAKRTVPKFKSHQRVPALVNFMKKLAHDQAVTRSLRNVSFELTETNLIIEGVKLPPDVHHRALDEFKDIFGKDLDGPVRFKLD